MKTGDYLNKLDLERKMLEEDSNRLGSTVESEDEMGNGLT